MMSYLKKNIFFLLLFLLIPLASQATTIKELEEEIAELKRINETQAKNLATALNQLQEVLSEFQTMHGQVDQSVHLAEMQQSTNEDSERRIELLEDKIQILLAQLEEIKTAGLLPPDQSSNIKQFQVYQKGVTKINAAEYKGAIQSLKSFLQTYPKSSYAPYAHYWIGESYFALRDFPTAVTEFQNVVKKFPDHEKVRGSLLKQGYAFYEMQSLDQSKAFLEKLISTHPDSTEANLAKARINKIKNLIDQKQKEALEKQVTM